MNEVVVLIVALTIGTMGVVLYDMYQRLRDYEALLMELKTTVGDGKLIASIFEQRERLTVKDDARREPLTFTVDAEDCETLTLTASVAKKQEKKQRQGKKQRRKRR